MQEQERQKIADSNARRNRERIEFVDRAIIRKQLPIAFGKLPEWQNVCHEAVTLEDTDTYGCFVYRVAKRDIEKHMSIAVCVEIMDTVNSNLRQLRFEAYESVNLAYQEAVYNLHSELSVLSARVDWNTPSVQAEFHSRTQNVQSRYALTYQNHAPFLVLLQVTGIEDAGNYLLVSVKITDESEYHRWHPQALPFC